MPTRLDQAAIDDALDRLHVDWVGAPDALTRTIEFANFLTAVEFVDRIAPRCEELDHHPDLALSWRRVTVRLSTHSEGGVTHRDVALAEVVDDVSAGLPLAG